MRVSSHSFSWRIEAPAWSGVLTLGLRSRLMALEARGKVRRGWITLALMLALGPALVLGTGCASTGEAAPEVAAAPELSSDPEAAGVESGVDGEDYDPLFDGFDEDLESAPSGFPDPLEGTNRTVFGFNIFMDKWLLDPLTKAYGWVFPGPVKAAIRRVFQNLGEPATTVNNLIQLEWMDAGVSCSRFVINTTVGLAGIFDPAARIGLPYHRSDFGQTLALAGTPSGAYVMLPLMGPNNTRDASGVLADFAMHPLTWFLGPTNFLLYTTLGGGQGISTREEALPKLEALREGSIDYYAALRNAYYQNRQAEIWSRREHRRDDWAEH